MLLPLASRLQQALSSAIRNLNQARHSICGFSAHILAQVKAKLTHRFRLIPNRIVHLHVLHPEEFRRERVGQKCRRVGQLSQHGVEDKTSHANLRETLAIKHQDFNVSSANEFEVRTCIRD